MTRAHHGYRENAGKPEATCWCQPMPHPVFPDLSVHRADYGLAMWDRGEQGPQLESWMVDAMWALVR